jgi:hypothetical protein
VGFTRDARAVAFDRGATASHVISSNSRERPAMTITLQLSAEQERQLEEGATRHDRTAVREILLQAVDATVDSILNPPRQPDSETRRALLEELATEFADLPPLSDEAVSRAGIYGDHP